jgi:hypothetical protein
MNTRSYIPKYNTENILFNAERPNVFSITAVIGADNGRIVKFS